MVSPKTPNMTTSIRKMKKIIFAIDAAPSAMPVNPKIAAMIAITAYYKYLDSRFEDFSVVPSARTA